MIASYYGRAAQHSYFAGCSTGGREAMIMSQRYPEYFDGIVSGDPAIRTGHSNLALGFMTALFDEAAPKMTAASPIRRRLFSDSDRKLIVNSVLQACDAKDGLKDGMIFNSRACQFDPATLVCSGSKTDSCLSKAQADALKKAFAGPKSARGDAIYPGISLTTPVSPIRGGIPGLLNGPVIPVATGVDFTHFDVGSRSGPRGGRCNRAAGRQHLDESNQFRRPRRKAAVLSWPERSLVFAARHARLLREDGQGHGRRFRSLPGAGSISCPAWAIVRAEARRWTTSTC